ncbi:hypothetical protein CDAR_188821 [Caerostris darwini]|uniref:DNA replication ATP-dependent helicase/nuclease DNA2 n=1 Tax=Caerostris darwini TaxID=1538125 RepID=A0AAV4VXQ0_9ARAC|nr:hypothetical protein CDAR_188821 [Caerostris darwini]
MGYFFSCRNLTEVIFCLLLMDLLSDNDDFVPPTPKNREKKLSVLAKCLESKSSFNTISKNKRSNQNGKRKKIGGISPEFKKFKDKAKQVTLFNYLKKELSPLKSENCSAVSYTHNNTAKVKLFSESECINTKNDDKLTIMKEINSNFCTVSHKNDTISKEKTALIESSIRFDTDFDIKRSDISKKSSFNCDGNSIYSENKSLKKNSFILSTGKNNAKTQLSPEMCSYSSEICNDVQNLKLDIDDLDKKISDNSLTDHVSLETHKCEEISDKTYLSSNENMNAVLEDSTSWLNDVDWKECDTFVEMGVCASKESQVHHPKASNFVENKFLFQVKEASRNDKNELHLVLRNNSGEMKTCILKGFWTDSLINIGDSVHVLKEFENNEVIVDNHSGFLVINPDFLLSSTAVVSTLFCMRKAALNHILPNWSSGNNVMMIGSLVHDIFQQAVNNNASSVKEIITILERVLKKPENLLCLSCQDTPEAEIKEKVAEYVPSISNWIKKHCSFERISSLSNLQVTHVEGIEDNVWSPKYGVKGKIDMTVKTNTCNQQTADKILPLELKTGRATYSAEHIGQINLYILMMEERNKELSEGLLLYLKDAANIKLVSADHNSRRGLIQLRNELAFYTSKWMQRSCNVNDIEHCHLPKPLNSKRNCGKCPYLLPCTVYQRALSEDKTLESDHAMHSLISSATNHLTINHLEYFVHWSNLLLLESNSAAMTDAFWTEESTSREKKSMCLSWLYLDKNVTKIENLGEISYVITFSRSSESPITSTLTSVGLKKGDYVAISKQGSINYVALTMGYLSKIEENSIEVTSDRDFPKIPQYKDCLFRIDKQISNSAAACVRNNLMHLMENENEASRLRQFIIDKQPPKFVKSLHKDVVICGRPILKELNKVQQRVVLKALMAEDYFLIKGLPGTGKTSTIVALVRLLISMGMSVLLTSYTHSAVDNILLKLKEHLSFLRIGQELRIHPSLKKYSFGNLTKDFSTVGQLKTFMKEQMVVATTCLSINHAIFKIRKFDVCIIDEASQINQIACIGPLFYAKKFILVGDDKQLPPLVINKKAREKGMEESLLQRLCNTDNYMELVIQYRMNKEIMRHCNHLTYAGALKCGSEKIAEAVLSLDTLKCIDNLTPDWVIDALQTDLKKSVIFINTDKVNICDSGNLLDKNDFEADVVLIILETLLKNKISECDVGIITPYRRQVDLIEGKLKKISVNEIEVNTVDQYQGRDKDVIIISCVKCKKSTSFCEKKGMILDDERRLNVAISRAKKKLIIIGSKSSLNIYEPFQRLIKCFTAEQIIDLLPDSFQS